MENSHKLIRTLACCALALGLISLSSAAQDTPAQEKTASPAAATTPATATTEEPAPAAPTTIPIGDVISRADAERTRIDEIQKTIEDSEIMNALSESLDGTRDSITERQQAIANVLARRHSLGELAGLREGLRRVENRITSIERSIAERTNELDTALLGLRADLDLWTRTQEATAASDTPATITEQISAITASLGPAITGLEEARNGLLNLQSRAVDQRALIGDSYDVLDADEKQVSADLFQAQDPPLWASGKSYSDFNEDVQRASDQLSLQLTDLQKYTKSHRDLLAFHALLIVAIGWGLRRARLTLIRAEHESTATSESALRALAHPWLAGLILGLLLIPYLHPERVRAFNSAIIILSLAPWIIVLRPIVPKTLRLGLWLLFVVGAIDVIRQLSDEIHDVTRVLTLIELVMIVVGGVIMMRRPWLVEAATRSRSGFWHLLFRRWLQLIILCAIIAIGASVLGYAQLAGRITIPVIWSLYVGGGWFAGVRIAEAVLAAIALSGHLDALNMIRNRREMTLRWIRTALRAAGLLIWFSRVLVMALLWGPSRALAGEILARKLEYGQVSFSIGGVLSFGLTLWISWTLARFISFAANEEVFTRIRLGPGVPYALTTFTRYAILVLGFLVAMAAVGLSVDRIALLISALGIGIGFGLQAIVNNFVSGVIVLFERPVRVGDLVQVDTLMGEVKDIGIRATKVRTFDGSDVLIPNGDLMSARLVNWTLSDQKRRITIPVRARFGADPKLVLGALEKAAMAHDEVLTDPAPDILFMGFGENGLEFELRAWTESPRGILAVRSDLVSAINELLEEAGIEIPVPQREVRIENPKEPGQPTTNDGDA